MSGLRNQPVAHVRTGPRQAAGQVFPCEMQAGVVRGLDQIQHRLGLCQIELSVQKRPFRELARLCKADTLGEDGVQSPTGEVLAAVQVQFERVFARVTAWGVHQQQAGSVERLSARPVEYAAEIEMVGAEGLPVRGWDDQLAESCECIRAADTNDRDSTLSRRSRDRGDRILLVHNRPRPSFESGVTKPRRAALCRAAGPDVRLRRLPGRWTGAGNTRGPGFWWRPAGRPPAPDVRRAGRAG